MEGKITSGVHHNAQAIDQIRAEIADIRKEHQKDVLHDKAIIELLTEQNNVLSIKVNSLFSDLD